MTRAITIGVMISALFWTGCGNRKYYEPENMHSASSAISKHGRSAIKVARDGVTYSDGSFVTRRGASRVKLPKGFHFVNQSSQYILAANSSAHILILDRSSGGVVKRAKLDYPLVSGAIHGSNVMYMLHNDVFGMYSLSEGKNLIKAKVGQAYAIDTRVANPILLSGAKMMAVPTLDGKLLIMNPKNPSGARGIAIGAGKTFNNVIFLSQIGNKIIAATPNKLVSAAPGANNNYETSIADVAIAGGFIYLLAKDGRIVKLTSSLKVVAEKKFQYAQFASLAIVGSRVYALDRQGSLVVLDSGLKKSRVYNVGEVDHYTFVAGARLYVDERVVNLSKLPL